MRSPSRAVPLVVLEQTTLFTSLLKWTALATGVGVITGLSTSAFLRVLDWATRAVATVPGRLLLLPVGFAAVSLLVRWLAPAAEGHGTEKVIEAVHRRWGRIPLRVAPVKLVATVLTLAVGGSVGKEGPCAQIGASLASSVASLLRLRPGDRRKLVICGISAGFATVFGTPIAGSIFGIEVLYLGAVSYTVLYPSFVAGIVGHHVASRLGLRHFHQDIVSVPAPNQELFLTAVLAGIVFGLVALLLIEALRGAQALAGRLAWPRPLVAAAGGALLAALGWLVSARYLGLGVDTLEAAVRGAPVPLAAFAWKILFTAISLGAGGSGGIVTPVFFVGATAGHAFGRLLGADPVVFSAIGMVALLSAAANTPLAASIMAIELFGAPIAPLAALASIVSFLMVGHRSVYPSQVMAIAKSPSVRVPTGREVGEASAVGVRPVRFRRLRLLGRAWSRLRRPPAGP